MPPKVNVTDPDPKNATPSTSIENQQIDPSTPLFRVRSFSLLFITRVCPPRPHSRCCPSFVGWHVYELTDSALQLGLIGLAQFMAPFCSWYRPGRSSTATTAACAALLLLWSHSCRRPA